MPNDIRYRWAPSLGALEDTPENIWGITAYNPLTDLEKPTVFCGLYGMKDFMALHAHKGKKWVWWTGSDIRHFKNGYWLDEEGKIRVDNKSFAQWIDENCESWVENAVEWEALEDLGITSKICPSFLGEFPEISYEPAITPKLYTSVSGNDFKLYGWDRIDDLAFENPDIEFHLYGNTVEWVSDFPNVIVHGRVSKEQMNEEIKSMQGALRLTEFDGFSEILAKSVLMGQWPVSHILYPHILTLNELLKLPYKTAPNFKGRVHYLNVLNKYPWNQYAIH